jgi:hypothetical protein
MDLRIQAITIAIGLCGLIARELWTKRNNKNVK